MSFADQGWLPKLKRFHFHEPPTLHVVLLLTVTIALVTLIVVQYAAGQPTISVRPTNVDWGIAYLGELKSAYVTVTNTGTERLQISAIHPSCGCAVISRPGFSIASSQKDSFLVQFDTFGSRGPIFKEVEIESNDPRSGRLVVPLRVEVREELQPASMSSIHWMGDLKTGSIARDTIYFRNVSSKQIRLLKEESGSETVTLKIRASPITPGDSLAVEVIAKVVQPGEQSVRFDLQTDSDAQRVVPLIVSYRGIIRP